MTNKELLIKYTELGNFPIQIDSFIKKSYDDDTPLHIASFLGYCNDLKIMLASIDIKYIDIKGDIGNTPLMCAINSKKYDCIHLLLKSGANPLVYNDYDDNAFDWADNETLNILSKYGWNQPK